MKPLYFILLFLAFFPQHLAAYIDPGSGSAIISAIIGLFAAVGLAIKSYWYKLKSLFTPNKKSSPADQTNQEN